MSKSDKLHVSEGFMANDHLAQGSHTVDPHPAVGSTTRLDVRFPLERELPLPVQLRSLSTRLRASRFEVSGSTNESRS